VLEIANLIDDDAPGLRFRLDRVQIRMRHHAFGRAAKRDRGDPLRQPGLSTSGRTRQQIGVRQSLRPPRFAQALKGRFF
jgi:hypothetical protein